MTTGAGGAVGWAVAIVTGPRRPTFTPVTIPVMKPATTKRAAAATGIWAFRMEKPELVPVVVAATPEGTGICSAGIGADDVARAPYGDPAGARRAENGELEGAGACVGLGNEKPKPGPGVGRRAAPNPSGRASTGDPPNGEEDPSDPSDPSDPREPSAAVGRRGASTASSSDDGSSESAE